MSLLLLNLLVVLLLLLLLLFLLLLSPLLLSRHSGSSLKAEAEVSGQEFLALGKGGPTSARSEL
eukprot:8578036-Pyramimonas_sp.AAC.1